MKAVYAIKCIYIPLWKGDFFVLKDFDQSQELKTIAKKKKKFTILHVPHIGFLCYSNWDQILLYGRWLEIKDEDMYCFMKFC